MINKSRDQYKITTLYDFLNTSDHEETNEILDGIMNDVTEPIEMFRRDIRTTELSKIQASIQLYNTIPLSYYESIVYKETAKPNTYMIVPVLFISKDIREAKETNDKDVVDFVRTSDTSLNTIVANLTKDGYHVSIFTEELDSGFLNHLCFEIIPKIAQNAVALESIDYRGRKALKEAVESTLAIFKLLDTKEYIRVKELIESYTKEEDLINFLINPINVYFEPRQEPTGLVLNAIKAKERIIVSEHMYMPFKGKVNVDGVSYPIRTAKRLTIYHTYVRKNQQIALKEAKSADTKSVSDILGMSAGGDKVGTFSDAEWTTCLQQNNFNVIKELCGPGSADLGQKKEMRTQLMNSGEVSLTDLPDSTDNKRVLHYLDHVLKSMGMDSDLVQFPE